MGKGTGFFTNYPKHVLLVLVNEFCERFSYYGMKVILVLYLTRALKYSESTAVSIYHAFSAVCYFTPLFGAMVADGWLGKYRTILYVSMIYALGNIAMSVTAIPFDGEYITWGVFIGLTLIGIGSGGIKPCVSAFGGDQFSDDQVRQKDSFFSLFYMFINVGSLLTTLITPYIRSNVFCFDDNCYALAFGIPAILMVISIGVFALGTPWYTKRPAGDSVLSRIFGCVGTALKGKFKCGKDESEKKEHWLDYAEDKYDKQFISDIKDVFGVLWLFLPLPFFWALYDQQGSRWTLQATQMNGEFGGFVMQPDMMGVMNSILVVIFAPLFESVIFPLLTRLKIPNTPIQRLTFGMIFGATAFLMAGFLQLSIDDSFPKAPEVGESKIVFINSSPCRTNVTQLSGFENEELPLNFYLDSLQTSDYEFVTEGNKSFQVTWSDCSDSAVRPDYQFWYNVSEEKAWQIVLLGNENKQTLLEEQTHLEPTPDSSSTFKFFNGLPDTVSLTLIATKKQEKDQHLYNVQPYTFSEPVELVFAKFYVEVRNSSNSTVRMSNELNSNNGAIYTVLLTQSQEKAGDVVMTQLTDMEARTVNIFLQVPQYIILTIGECLFSITGLAFAYSQAPKSMKSLLTAAWLLTVAVGNLIIIIIAETTSESGNEAMIFFLFAGLLYVVSVLFAIMGFFYKYVTPRNEDDDNKSIASSSSSSSSGSSHSGQKKTIDGVVVEASGEKPPLADQHTIVDEKIPPKDGYENMAMSAVNASESDSNSDRNSHKDDDDDDDDDERF